MNKTKTQLLLENKKIHAVHLLNDFSGSPLVFSEALKPLIKKNEAVYLYTATPSGNGFLSDCEGAHMQNLFYKWSRNKWITLFYFLFAQTSLFFKLLFRVKKMMWCISIPCYPLQLCWPPS